MTPPPPLQQQRSSSSGEWRHPSRSSTSLLMSNNNNWESRRPLGPSSRPSSRNASWALNYSDMSSQLSAREQEHVARVTGSPFFNLSSENSRQDAPLERNGLINAIGLREREKREMREGVSNHMVQHAIAQRQQQQARSMTPAPGGYGHTSMYTLPGANRTWDEFSQFSQVHEPRRQSWYYGQFTAPPEQQPHPMPMQGQNQSRNLFQHNPSKSGYF